jgi:hypothetical protein
VAVVNVDVPNDTSTVRAEMDVLNTDEPGITIDGEQDGADVDVDPDGDDDGSLATVGLSVSYDGTLNSTTFTWNPSQDVIWLTDQIGTVGVSDLGSLPGSWSDSGGDHHTWDGKPPADLYAQASGGSPADDGTSMGITANVSMPATWTIAGVSTSASSNAEDTQAGVIIVISGSGMVPDSDASVAGQILVGSGITATAVYVGPPPGGISNIHWAISGATTNPISATAIAGYNPSAPLPTVGGHSTQVTTLSAANLSQGSVHFYFIPDGNLSDLRKIEISCYVGEVAYNVQSELRVWTPNSELTLATLGTMQIEKPFYSQGSLHYRFGLDTTNNPADIGIAYSGSVTLPSNGLFSGGELGITYRRVMNRWLASLLITLYIFLYKMVY